MDSQLKVTDTPTESSFSDIMAGDNVVNIPLFQREYKWTKKNLDQFWDDIEAILDGTKKSQFLGVVVTVPQPKPMGTPPINDVVDGQQRLFTCYLAILAAVRIALDENEKDWALEVARSYLLLRQHSSYPTNTKVVPSGADRQQFHRIWYEVANHKTLDAKQDWNMIGFPTPPAPSGNETGKLLTQFNLLKKRFGDIVRREGLESVKRVVEIIVSSLSFVTISLKDPIVAPIIFERLNSRGEKITTADLVRNEIFSRVASDPDLAQTLFATYWKPFQENFDSRQISIEVLLFPYGLAIDSNITKAELFGKLRENWAKFDSPREIIEDMDNYTDTLFALETGTIASSIPKELRGNLTRFHNSNLPTSIYSFVFKCVENVKQGNQNATDIKSAFDVIEAFLVRRAVCGFEPSGLHAVFKGMYDEISRTEAYGSVISSTSVTSEIRRRTTVPWPNDESFAEAILENGIYNRRICRFVVSEMEIASDAEASFDGFWIEHVLPRSKSQNWSAAFTDAEHEKLVDTLANLVPLSAEMNNIQGQNNYLKKREAFANSKFAAARNFAKTFETWSPGQMETRARKLSEWAVKRWPRN